MMTSVDMFYNSDHLLFDHTCHRFQQVSVADRLCYNDVAGDKIGRRYEEIIIE